MSIEYITAVWELSPYKAEKLVVQLACADWANHDGEFWPSLTEIARKARITKPGAIGIMEQLRDDGEFIQLEANTGRGHTNRYRFGDRYQEAVQEIRSQWQQKREIKGKPPLPIADEERVNENIKRVNENGIKGKPELAHIRKNRHEPSIEPSVCESPVPAPASPHTQDPVGIATSILGMIPIYLQETIEAADITQPHLWRKCCEDWKASRYSLRNIPGLIDKYRRAESQDARDKENTINGKNRTYKTAGERAAESTIELARKLAPAGGNGADPAIPGFEWFDAVAGIGNGDLPADLDSNANRNPKRITQGRV